jgi:hydrogenase maturation protease
MNSILVLGLGNRLLGDDAAGPLAIDQLERAACVESLPGVLLKDGGTIGLGLLPAIEGAAGLIAVDAARLGLAPGTVTVLEGDAMDRALGGRKATAHEVALADLVAAAALEGALPAQRALVAVEPVSVAVARAPSPVIAAAIPRMCDAVRTLVASWALAQGAHG